ncbi:uncharacterized protein K452DRAFT_359889 [Aplosporella prunicola CBS 121167]|uniref:F-box domain-containing protein n=1 Tax=Aplosporella prunicola CBS 121167 TaxID=1176127 RepID=A0A6A6BCM1_9PEZI|nr:uncharacterized protein K452DRAFT_359889 [Aplosporella prunicola CBS 121167]KAF2140231.1 hypothetical protein K452DRAFT_359889 [Aplosporella prunicola CBS 121167]
MPTHQHVAQCPQLPLELWTHVLSFITDSEHIPKLWVSGRRVSRLFRVATEDAFLKTQLKVNTRIKFFPQRTEFWQDDKAWFFNFTMCFDRLTEGGSRAVFKDIRSETWLRDHGYPFDQFMAKWKKEMNNYTGLDDDLPLLPEETPWMIINRILVHDSGLPGLRVDYDSREISFEWCGMFDKFYGEELFARQQTACYARSHHDDLQELCDLHECGASEIYDATIDVFELCREDAKDGYATARRQRIKQWHKENDSGVLAAIYFRTRAFDESKKLEDMDHRRQVLWLWKEYIGSEDPPRYEKGWCWNTSEDEDADFWERGEEAQPDEPEEGYVSIDVDDAEYSAIQEAALFLIALHKDNKKHDEGNGEEEEIGWHTFRYGFTDQSIYF